jgi:hypothetical protein
MELLFSQQPFWGRAENFQPMRGCIILALE